MRDYEPYYTEDGSIGLYSYKDKDVFHSKFGALTEAWETVVIPSNPPTVFFIDASERPLTAQDICIEANIVHKTIAETFFVRFFKLGLSIQGFCINLCNFRFVSIVFSLAISLF